MSKYSKEVLKIYTAPELATFDTDRLRKEMVLNSLDQFKDDA